MTGCGDLLKTFIAESGKPPKAIAAQAGITTPYLILLQHGQRTPSDAVLSALAKALDLDPQQTQRLQEAAQQDRGTRRTPRPKQISGIVRVHPAFPWELFGQWVGTARHRIWILQTYYSQVMVHFKEAFITAATTHAGNPAFTTRILLLDPGAAAAELRSKDILISSLGQLDTDDVRQFVPKKIQACLDEFHLLQRIIQNKIHVGMKVEQAFLEIRTHACLPSFSLYLCDDQAFIGFYLHGDVSIDGPHLEVDLSVGREASPLIDMVQEEFETLWSVSSPAPGSQPVPKAAQRS